jgi:hypothetical protein
MGQTSLRRTGPKFFLLSSGIHGRIYNPFPELPAFCELSVQQKGGAMKAPSASLVTLGGACYAIALRDWSTLVPAGHSFACTQLFRLPLVKIANELLKDLVQPPMPATTSSRFGPVDDTLYFLLSGFVIPSRAPTKLTLEEAFNTCSV